MEIITNIIQTTLESFDFAFCIAVNVLTYFVITTINDRAGHKDLSIWQKRSVLLFVIALIAIIYYIIGVDSKRLLNSAILAPVFWSWILKPICKKFKIDYKQISLFE